ncbi:MAG: Lin1244/Lin1753 domain-containing protein [Halieaceae bacterium]
MKWFKHDTNAHTDAKLDKVLMHYGAHGYAVYWYCLELIAGKIDPQNIGCALEHDAEQIGARLKIDSAEVSGILTYMVDIGLFERQIEGAITCLKLLGRLDKSMTNSPQLRKVIGDMRHDMSANVMTRHDMSADVTPDKIRIDKIRKEKTHTSETRVSAPPIPVNEIVELYHQKLPMLPAVRKLTKSRRSYIQQRWRENDLPSLEVWGKYFDYVGQSDFLCGRTQGKDGRPPFMADLEWITKPANYVKIFEGKYHGV